jgi:hypothetical protein
MIYCSSQILHHPVVVTFIQQSWSNSKSIFLVSFFTLLILISLLIYNFLFYDIMLFTDPAPPNGGDLYPAELVQQQVHLPRLLLHSAHPDKLTHL